MAIDLSDLGSVRPTRKERPPPAKEGRVLIDEVSTWPMPGAWARVKAADPRPIAWRGKVDLPPVIALDKARAWADLDRMLPRWDAEGCIVLSVQARGHRMGDTEACEAHWWIDVLCPPGFDPRKAGLARAY